MGGGAGRAVQPVAGSGQAIRPGHTCLPARSACLPKHSAHHPLPSPAAPPLRLHRCASFVTRCPPRSSAPLPPRRALSCFRTLCARQRSVRRAWRWRRRRAPPRALPAARAPLQAAPAPALLTAATRLSWWLRSSCCGRSLRRRRCGAGPGAKTDTLVCWLACGRLARMLLRCTALHPHPPSCPVRKPPAAGGRRRCHGARQAV